MKETGYASSDVGGGLRGLGPHRSALVAALWRSSLYGWSLRTGAIVGVRAATSRAAEVRFDDRVDPREPFRTRGRLLAACPGVRVRAGRATRRRQRARRRGRDEPHARRRGAVLVRLWGDLFAIVWRDGVAAYNGSGRTPAAMTAEVVRAAAGDAMPERGPLPVTVPGAVEAWFSLLDRFGTRSFGQLANDALRYARDGFPITELGAESIAEVREEFAGSAAWQAVYGQIHRLGDVLQQPDLARTIQALADGGPDVYYRGPIAAAIAEAVSTAGGLVTTLDLAEHRGEWVEPLSARYRDVDVLELPPNTQGVAVLEALRILDELGPLPPDGLDRQHRLSR